MANQYSLFAQNNSGIYKTWNDYGHMTPNVEYSEGIRPTGEFMPAPYLPAIRYDPQFEEYKVVSDGMPVCFDSNGYLVPAGFRIDAALYKSTFEATAGTQAANIAAADAAVSLFYTATDVSRGVLNALGVAVVAGEPVVKSFFDTAGWASGDLDQTTTLSHHVGTADYDFWSHPGGDGVNPAYYNKMNFNLQHRVGFLTDYMLQLPLCEDATSYAAAPMANLAAIIAASGTLKPGMFITYDVNSIYVPTTDGYTFTADEAPMVVGQVIEVRTDFPRDYLDKVRTRYNDLGDLNKMPGTATSGMPHEIAYSNGYGLASVNLIKR